MINLAYNYISSNNKKEFMIEDDRKKQDIQEDQRDNKEKILLDNNKCILKPE